jgi:hypothetical protein
MPDEEPTSPELETLLPPAPPEILPEEPTPMLDVHPAHHAANSWKEFLVHIATIVLGLLIAVGLEQTVEYIHHRRQIAETREALHAERELNRKIMQQLVAEFRTRTAAMQKNLADFHYLEQHPGAPIERLPTRINWHSVGGPFNASVWTTAQQGQILSLMPPEEVRADGRLYRFLETASSSFDNWRAASTEARAYTVDASSPSVLTPAEIQEQIRLTRIVLNRLYRFGSDLRNVSMSYPDFAYGPSTEELGRVVHESTTDRSEIEARALDNAAQSSETPKP